MLQFSTPTPSWQTSSLGHFEETFNQEQSTLDSQLSPCGVQNHGLSNVLHGASQLHGMWVNHTLTGALIMAVIVTAAWLNL